MSLDENTFMKDINEAFRNLQRGAVNKIESITIHFPIIDDDGTPVEPSFQANGNFDGTYEYTTLKLDASLEMKAMAKSLKEKAESQIVGQKALLKDKLREILLKAASEV